jgi:hypothetical protein
VCLSVSVGVFVCVCRCVCFFGLCVYVYKSVGMCVFVCDSHRWVECYIASQQHKASRKIREAITQPQSTS